MACCLEGDGVCLEKAQRKDIFAVMFYCSDKCDPVFCFCFRSHYVTFVFCEFFGLWQVIRVLGKDGVGLAGARRMVGQILISCTVLRMLALVDFYLSCLIFRFHNLLYCFYYNFISFLEI